MPAVSFQSVSKTYVGPRGSLRALDEVGFDIERGEFFGLLGPNGAGKTTLISILAGLARASAGRVTVMGHDVVSDYAAARRALGIVPQELVFDPFFSVRETLRIQSGYFGLKRNDAWIDELLQELGLADKHSANMRQLSGGMKRRVLVAQALVHRPPVIVLDEPTAGVDVELRQTLWQFIARLNREGHTVAPPTCWPARRARCCASRPTSRCRRRWPPGRVSRAASRSCRRTTPPKWRRCSPRCAPQACVSRTWKSAAPTWRTCSWRSCTGRRHERAVPFIGARPGAGGAQGGPMSGVGTLLYKEVLRFWKVAFQTVAAPVLTAVRCSRTSATRVS